jgi:hypothetical protein
VEVVAQGFDYGALTGYFRRTDDRGSSGNKPEADGSGPIASWNGQFTSRYLSMSPCGDPSTGSEPLHEYSIGAVGADAVTVDLKLGDGRSIPTTLGPPISNLRNLRFWIADYWPADNSGAHVVAVATDSAGKTWQLDGGTMGFGATPNA